MIVLLIIYLPAFISYVLSKRAISPILQVIKNIENINISNLELDKLDFSNIDRSSDSEVAALIETFENFSQRISNFVKRERNFSRYASHELRTPLAVMKGSLAMLDKKIEEDSQKKVVKRMQNMVDEMQELIESLLLLSREQNTDIELQELIINDFVQPLTENIQCNFKEKDIKIKFDFKNLIESKVSEQLLSIVLNNLIRNAFLYSSENSEITIKIEQSKLTVIDQGLGLSEDQLENIFNPFYRVDEHSEVKGFGLGLAIVKWICQQANWTIQFESTVNVGTKAILDLKQVKILA